MNCIVCDKPINKKARYCSDKCKQVAYRNRKQEPTVTSVTFAPVTEPAVTPPALRRDVSLELCRYCGELLPKLAKLRRWPGACYDCALKQPRKPSIEALDELVYAGSEYVPPAE